MMPEEQSSLLRFLRNNNIPDVPGLPLVHTTTAYAMHRILKKKSIQPTPCDVFTGESLAYFFCGRPAYKKQYPDNVAKTWQLPSCIIVDWDIVSIKRQFPFDSGAFQQGKLPDFIDIMDLSEFDAGSNPADARRIIGSFFVDSSRYFKMTPRSSGDFDRTFELTILDAEISALKELSGFMLGKVDDRRFAIEVQTSEPVDLVPGKVLAVVCPEEYLDHEEYVNYIAQLGAKPLPYATYPLKTEMYYYTIYNLVFEFFKQHGLVS
jgi:hypothetical protein